MTDNRFQPDGVFGEDWIKRFGWKQRVKLLVMGLLCQVQRVTGYDDNGTCLKGWHDYRKGVTYITWMRK